MSLAPFRRRGHRADRGAGDGGRSRRPRTRGRPLAPRSVLGRGLTRGRDRTSYGSDVARRYLTALVLGAVCLATLVAGLVLEDGATLVGASVVAGVLSIAALVDGWIRRVRVSRRA